MSQTPYRVSVNLGSLQKRVVCEFGCLGERDVILWLSQVVTESAVIKAGILLSKGLLNQGCHCARGANEPGGVMGQGCH